MAHRSATLVLVLSLPLAGCDGNAASTTRQGSEAESAPVYACHAPSENDANCVEWRGGAFADEEAARQECAANRGEFVGNACPTENRVARCVRHRGSVMEQHEVWYGPKVTAETVEFGCKGPDTEYRAG